MTRPSARDEALEICHRLHDQRGPYVSSAELVDAIPTDVLRRLADERMMAKP